MIKKEWRFINWIDFLKWMESVTFLKIKLTKIKKDTSKMLQTWISLLVLKKTYKLKTKA